MSRAIKLLMICYYYPPLGTSGTYRSLMFSKLIQELGCEPVVLTVSRAKDRWVLHNEPVPTQVRIERSIELDLTGIVEFLYGATVRVCSIFGKTLSYNPFREYFCIPDAQISWLPAAKGINLATECDCIYVSCSPFSAALSGYLIKKGTGKPLVLDFRDAWSLNPHNKHRRFHQHLISRMEHYVLQKCDRLILNTTGAGKLYKETYPDFSNKILVIPNGFDRLNLPTDEDWPNDKFRIVHVGNFYGRRNPDLLLEALADLDDPDLEFIQVGSHFQSYEKYTDRLSIRLVGSVPREEALRFMRASSLLYLKQGWEDNVVNHIAVGAKTYEYLATGRPILADCPPGDNRLLVQAYANCSYIVTSQDKENMIHLIKKAKKESRSTKPRVSEEFVATFSRKKLAERLVDVIRDVISSINEPDS